MARTFDHLSGSTDGQPIEVTADAFGSANTLHTASATAGEKEFVTIQAYNTDTVDRTLNLLWGTSTEANALEQVIPTGKGAQVIVPRGFIDNGGVIKAWASVASKIFILGDTEIVS